MMVGSTTPGSRVWQDGQAVRVSAQGRFPARIHARRAGHLRAAHRPAERRESSSETLQVAEREYRIQRIDGLPERKVTPRKPEDLARIRRDVSGGEEGAGARRRPPGFSRPASPGQCSALSRGVYGSQRVLNGEPRRPHFGVDVAAPVGTPVRAPAPGIVTLAEPDMFFSGGTLIIDHGHD